jgi:hypothetical protein
LGRDEQTGVLEVEGDGACTMIYVQRGVPVFAEEGTLGETLGRILLRERQITQEQYGAIIERMTNSVIGAEQMRFGEVAVVLGFLPPEQVNEALARQVRHKVMRCLEWESAHCVFRESAEELEGIARYPSPIEPLVLHVVRSVFDEARVARMLGDAATRFPELVDSADRISERFRLDPADAAFLGEIKGDQTTFQLIYGTSLGGVLASQLLAVLIVAEAVVLRDDPTTHPVPTAAPAAEVAPPPSQVHPDPPPAAPQGAGEAARQLARVRLARRLARPGEGPTSPGAPAATTDQPTPPGTKSLPPPVKHARLRAEQLFQSGKVHVKNERWPLAVTDLEHAVRLFPGAVEYQLYAEWAKSQNLSESTEMTAVRGRLRDLAFQALRQDRQMAFAHYVLGQVQLMEGDEKLALRSFRIATKLDPGDRTAARFHRMLSRKLE